VWLTPCVIIYRCFHCHGRHPTKWSLSNLQCLPCDKIICLSEATAGLVVLNLEGTKGFLYLLGFIKLNFVFNYFIFRSSMHYHTGDENPSVSSYGSHKRTAACGDGKFVRTKSMYMPIQQSLWARCAFDLHWSCLKRILLCFIYELWFVTTISILNT
jgi:hypothetical protein